MEHEFIVSGESIHAEDHSLITVAFNRKMMTCEIVHTDQGHVLRVYDAWVYGDDDHFNIVTDWKFADVGESKDIKVEAVWIKQEKNYTIETDIKNCNTMVKTLIRMLIGNDGNVCFHYFGKKTIEIYDMEIPLLNDILNKSDDINMTLLSLLNLLIKETKVLPHIVDEIR